MKRKLLSVLLTLCLAFSLLPTAALADEGEASGNVAKVGEQGYATLQAAINAAKDGDTVTLLGDVTTKATIPAEKTITIDLNGKTLKHEGQVLDIYGNLTIKHGTVELSSGNAKAAIWLNKTAKLTVESDATVSVPTSNFAIGLWSDCTAAELMVKGTLKGGNGLTVNGNIVTLGNKVTVDGATIESEGHGIYQAGVSDIIVKNANIKGSTAIEVRAGKMTVESGTFTATATEYKCDPNGDGTTTEGAALAIAQHTTKKDIGVTINGGTFNGIKALNESNPQNNEPAPQVDLKVTDGTFNGDVSITDDKNTSISGGTFTSDVSAYVPNGYIQNENGAVETLGETNAVAKVGGTYYKTLADAVAAAQDGDTITLLKDAELTSTLNLAKNITIDGQGKYTIKAANSFTVGSDNKTYCVLYVSGEVTLKDVTVNGNEKCRVIFCDKGKLTIDGATITNGKAPNFIGGVYMTSSASFEMKSGSITGNKNAKEYQNDEYLQYSSDLWIGANANGALTAINGGTIGNVFVNANAWSASNPGSFTMNGGTVTNLYVEHDANYGATFKYNDGTIEHLYLSKENGNGQSIEVTPVKGVIYNGGVKEEDLVTLTLKYNDGATADTTYNVASGTTITLPTPAYRSGYTFNGWYDGSTKVSSPYKVTKNVILTASWSYNYSGGSSSYDPTYSVSTPSKTENGSVTVSPKNASKGDTVTVTVKPDSGYVLETLTVTDKNGNELTLKDKGNGKYTFTMPAGKVEVKATFMEDNSMLNFFYDVPNNAYFYEAVKWAVKNGITTGVGNNLFAPEQPCTRAQIVTFLWRAAGSPEPKGAASGMTDVVSGSYYEKAVAWAIENGITTGTTTSTFSPDATCTRAQAVTFLARALKAKAASAAEFSDVPTGSYFADAVAWAAANGVTEGIGGGLFGSDNDCTRGQIVTFLYRAYNK